MVPCKRIFFLENKMFPIQKGFLWFFFEYKFKENVQS